MSACVAVDVGGTHARFAIATIADDHIELDHLVTLRTSEHADFQHAWRSYAGQIDAALPNAVAIAFAGPVQGAELKLTNNPWVLRPAALAEEVGVARTTIVNDFAAIAHALSFLGDAHLAALCGPSTLPRYGMYGIVGPGTGLGVGTLLRTEHGDHALPSEGGHIGFAPLDDVEDAILGDLRKVFGRVSVERILSGPGLAHLYEALGAHKGRGGETPEQIALWKSALDGSNERAVEALGRFCRILGSVAGDIALVQRADAVLIGGGLGLRLAAHLPRSGFAERFVAKGRFEALMQQIPVKIITHPQPGLLGAAAAFAKEHAHGH